MENIPTNEELIKGLMAWRSELMDDRETARIALEEAGDSDRIYGYSRTTLLRIWNTWKSGKKFYDDYMDWTIKTTFPHQRAFKSWMKRLEDSIKEP